MSWQEGLTDEEKAIIKKAEAEGAALTGNAELHDTDLVGQVRSREDEDFDGENIDEFNSYKESTRGLYGILPQTSKKGLNKDNDSTEGDAPETWK